MIYNKKYLKLNTHQTKINNKRPVKRRAGIEITVYTIYKGSYQREKQQGILYGLYIHLTKRDY
jgi:hypothetical protein